MIQMSETDEILETGFHGTEIQAAVLHVIDGRHRYVSLSERTLDLEEPMTEKYVKRYVSRCRSDMRTRQGSFTDTSLFGRETGRYFRHETTLPEYSSAVCRKLIDYFEQEEARSFEVLFADYRTDDVPYIAVILLEEQDTMTYSTNADNGTVQNTLSFGHTSLPSFTKPVSSFAVINQISQEILFVDEGKWKNGISLMKDILLEAEAGFSRKEVVETVKNITVEVAEEFDENPAILLGKVKNHIASAVNEGMPLNTETLVSEVFEEKPDMASAFRQKAYEKTLPAETELPKTSVRVSMKKQKVVTDTGIEISFPAEYADDDRFISFHEEADGTLTISVKQIGKLTNKL